LGLDNLLVRTVAGYAQQEKWGEIVGLCRQSLKLVLFTSIGCALLIAGGADWIALVLLSKPSLAGTLRVMAGAVVPLSLLMLCGEMLRGLQKVNLATFMQLLGVPLLSCGLAIGSIVGWGYLNLQGVTIIYLLATTIVGALAIGYGSRSLPSAQPLRSCSSAALLKQGTPFLGVTACSLALSSIDILLLGVWTDSQTVAVYGVVSRIASLTAFFLTGVNSVVSPKFAMLYADRQYDQLARLAGQASALTIVLTLPLLIPLICFPGFFLNCFGAEYVSGATALVILVLGQLFNALTGSVGCLLLMTGRERSMQINLVGVVIFNGLMNIGVIPRFGLLGTAVINSLSLVILNSVSVLFVYRKFSIVISPLLCFNSPKVKS
jgi:O-antigen/teichoic acid export membrane protein